MKYVRRIYRLIILASAVLCCVPCGPTVWAVDARRGKVSRPDGVVDENAIYLENDYLRAAITTNEYAGQVMELIYKPTDQELSAFTDQGYCMDRTGEDRFFWRSNRGSEDYSGRIVETTPERAVAEVSYTWNYDHADRQTTFRIKKQFELRKTASVLLVTWSFENTGDQEVFFTPWVKHLGGREGHLLSGPTLMLGEQGPYDPGTKFVKPVTDWMVRLSGRETTTERPMVTSVMDYTQIFQQFPWGGRGVSEKPGRFTLETVLNRVTVAPDEQWEITYALGVAPNLEEPLYVAPELAAEMDADAEPEAGKPCHITVRIAPTLELGAKRLEGDVLDFDGKTVAKLPNREVTLTPGEFATAEYRFTPPAEGVYQLSLTVYDEQDIYRLGQDVNTQQSSITLPLVVGPRPKTVVKKWQAGEFSWPRREERDVKPYRTMLNTRSLKAGQILAPRRVFLEDEIVFSDTTQPAHIRLARGERECLQFAVSFPDPKDATELSVEVTPLKHEDGDTIEEPVLREQLYLTTDVPSGYKDFPIGQWPDPLFHAGWEERVPDAPFARQNMEYFKEGGKRVYWLTVKAPRKGAGGIYKGDVVLKLNDEEAARFPVEIEVDSFALPKRASFRCSTGLVSFSSRKEFRSNMKALGMDPERIAELAEEGIMDKTRKLLLRYGWTPTMWFGPEEQRRYYDYGRGVNWFSLGAGASQEHMDWLKEKGLMDYAFVYAPFDEHPEAEVPEVAKWCREWKEKHDIPILDCYYGNRVEPLFGLVDIWLGQSPQQEWAQKRKKKGDRFVGVNQSLIWFVESDPSSGRAQFWRDYMIGYDGRYVYSTARWTENVWEKNWTSGNYMGCVVYPDPTTGITSSIRLETLRDGVEDYDYLTILQEKVNEAGEDAPAGALQEAKAILAEEHIQRDLTDADDIHRMRNRIADLIEKLDR